MTQARCYDLQSVLIVQCPGLTLVVKYFEWQHVSSVCLKQGALERLEFLFWLQVAKISLSGPYGNGNL